ncbi:MAG: thioredoxin-dependent thiol peroxidase [Saprospiraceae bacterium]|nr:thioredoxin-dependent thiol peroxidase [Saprospiraceae bacterium]
MEEYKPKFLLHEGDLFPDVTLFNQDIEERSIYKVVSKYTILFFYPEDDTPTCTKEACGLRDNLARLKEHDCTVFGISPDSAKSHQKFISKYGLNYDLLTDKDHLLADALGIWGEKFTFGRAYEGLHRVSYILNQEKKIQHLIYPVESQNHTQQILDRINS